MNKYMYPSYSAKCNVWPLVPLKIIFHKYSLGLEDELITFWGAKAVTASRNTFEVMKKLFSH